MFCPNPKAGAALDVLPKPKFGAVAVAAGAAPNPNVGADVVVFVAPKLNDDRLGAPKEATKF